MKDSPYTYWPRVLIALIFPLVAVPAIGTEHFHFRMPHAVDYRVESSVAPALPAAAPQWIKAWPELGNMSETKWKPSLPLFSVGTNSTSSQIPPPNGSTNSIELGSRVVLQLKSAADLKRLTAGHPLELSRTVAPNLFILQAPDALTAAKEAHRLSALDGVVAAYPESRGQAGMHGPYAPQPTDTFFPFRSTTNPWEWPLENRDTNGNRTGPDINVRAAWPYSLGQGVTIAFADSGLELTHPEFIDRVAGAPHFNFLTQDTNAVPYSRSAAAAHGTEAAGLAVASLNNARMVGVAPEASLASWLISDGINVLATDEQLMDMYQYQSNVVSIQNHSWGNNGLLQLGPDLVEQVGISNAIEFGRSALGVVMVRSAGNNRASQGNANDNGYGSDPRAIGVAAVRMDGRVSSYSSPGASILLGALSDDMNSGFTGIFTTDLLGTDGANQLNFFPPFQDMNNYVWFSLGFSGTSAAAPQVSGIAALMLSVNPSLSYRDVQQILLLSARHFDFADPDLTANGAGFLVSHNDGFGVPDAGVAVRLARTWLNRPPATNLVFSETNVVLIPDDGLRVQVTGAGVPANLASIHCLPSTGPHADNPTAQLPLVDFGYGTNLSGYNLTNKAALIQRGGGTFANIISTAAQAGASFAIVYNFDTNNAGGGDSLTAMAATDFVPIPAVFIGHSDGVALQNLFLTNSAALAQIHLTSTSYVFSVTNTLLCEHVGLRVQTDHSSRSDVRITLVSPMGTRSVLQRLNNDFEPGPVDWTYYSTHHFFETSAGTWTAYISDESTAGTGSVLSVSLILEGVPIHDRDHNALDDYWEITYWDSIFTQSPKDDPDHDGYSNAREQLMDTDPTVNDALPFSLDLSLWNASIARLSWTSSPLFRYEVWGGTNAAALNSITNMPGQFSETEWFTPYSSPSAQFFKVKAITGP